MNITFYSYKGGVGRSLLLSNIAVEIIKRGRDVVCIDFDLEGGALHKIFDISLDPRRPTILDYITPGVIRPPIENAIVDIKERSENLRLRNFLNKFEKKLLLLPVKSDIVEIPQVLEQIADTNRYYAIIRNIINQIYDNDIIAPDGYILIDSRSGFVDYGYAAVNIANKTVVVLRPNKQNAEGLKRVVEVINALRNFDSNNIYYVLSQVPTISNLDQKINQIFGEVPDFRPNSIIHYFKNLSFEEKIVSVEYPRSQIRKDYLKVANWILGENK